MTATDPRVDRLEREVDRVQEQINNLHSSSMHLVTTAFTEMERRLGDKIDKNSQSLSNEIDGLRAGMVPMSEHVVLTQRVEHLWNRDLQGREAWDQIVPRVQTMWEDRTKRQGAVWAYRIAAGVLGLTVVVLTAINLLHSLGFHV